MTKKNTSLAYLFVLSLFLIIISPNFLSRGMFVDGVVYANISKNYALGQGSFFHPFYSHTYLTDFSSHPPMFFFLQGLAFKAFGVSFLIEKIYSFVSVLITAIIMIRIYKKFELKNSFLPLFFLSLIPLISWSATNNIIENTLMIFTTLSVLFYIKSLESKRFLFLILSSFSVIIGFSLKGFVALFPFSFPFFYFLVIRKIKFSRLIIDTLFLFAFAILFYIVLFSLSQEAWQYFLDYFNIQIMGDMLNNKLVDSRFYIVWRFIGEIIIVPIIIGLYSLILFIKKKENPFSNKSNNKIGLMFLLFSLSSVLPIMITMKQSGFYLLPSLPFVAIGFAALIDESIEKLIISLKPSKLLKLSAVFLFLVAVLLNAYFYKKDNRDREMLHDMDIIATNIPKNVIINTIPKMEEEYSLFAYYSRFHNISIDLDIRNKREYVLIKKELDNDFDKSDYKRLDLNTKSYFLYKKSI